jgi:hypothetical protein
MSGETGYWKRLWQEVIVRGLGSLLTLAVLLLLGLVGTFVVTLAVRIVWSWWDVSHITVESFNSVMRALPWWPIVALAILAVIALRHREALEYLIRNLRLKHGETELSSRTQMAIDTGATTPSITPSTGGGFEDATTNETESTRAEIALLRNKLIYYQLNQDSKTLLRRLNRQPDDYLSSRELNNRAMGSNELTSEIRALQTAGLIVRESPSARSYKITEFGQQVMALEETEQD